MIKLNIICIYWSKKKVWIYLKKNYRGSIYFQESEESHSDSLRCSWGGYTGQYWPFESREHWQKIVTEMGKCHDGLPGDVAKLRALGNSVVPQQVKQAFKILMGI